MLLSGKDVASQLRTPQRGPDRITAYLEMVAHRCPGCGKRFEGAEAFLGFLRHLDLSVACKHGFEDYLDALREEHSGGD